MNLSSEVTASLKRGADIGPGLNAGELFAVFTNDQALVEETLPEALAMKISKQCTWDSEAETVFAEGERTLLARELACCAVCGNASLPW